MSRRDRDPAVFGADVVATALLKLGIDTVVGNPGTTELPLLRAMRDAGITYHLALHEDVATGIAYGMGWATGRAHIAQVHAAPGLAHALGNVYNAMRSRVPMVVIAGMQDRRFGSHEPILWGPADRMASGWFKWSYEIGGVADINHALVRAVRTAEAYPQGPVFVSVPYDVLVAEAEEPFRGLRQASRRLIGIDDGSAWSGVGDAVEMVAAATSPVIVVGDGFRGAGATSALERLAGHLRAPIYWEPLPTRNPISTTARGFKGSIGVSAHRIRQRLAKHDLLLAVGAPELVPSLYSHENDPVVPSDLSIVEVAETAAESSHSYVPDVTVIGPCTKVVSALAAELERRGLGSIPESTAGKASSEARVTSHAVVDSESPFEPAAVVAVMAEALPSDVVIIDEALSSSGALLRFYPFAVENTYSGNKGGGIGLGIPAGVGVALARADKTAVVYTGDGSAMYTLQALWTAAQLELRVIVIVCNNGGYSILKAGMRADGVEPEPQGEAEFDISDPALDLCLLAEGMGVKAARPSTRAELTAALKASLHHHGPTLLDIAVISPTASPQH